MFWLSALYMLLLVRVKVKYIATDYYVFKCQEAVPCTKQSTSSIIQLQKRDL